MKKTQLEIKVMAVNQLNKFSREFYAHAMRHFAPFLGQDIFKVDGSLKKKFSYNTPSFEGRLPDGTYINAHCWVSLSHGSFDLTVKICVNGGSYDVQPVTAFCQYEQKTIELFTVKNGILLESEYQKDKSYLEKVYSVEELQTAAADIIEAGKKYAQLVDSFPYIFRDVCGVKALRY